MDTSQSNLNNPPSSSEKVVTPQSETKIISSKPEFSILYIIITLLIIFIICLGGYLVYYNAKIHRISKTPYINTTTATPFPISTLIITPIITLDSKLAALKPEVIENPAQGRLAFVSQGEIYVIKADRTGKEQVTNDEYSKYGLSISPDGKKIAYMFYPKKESDRNSGNNVGLAILDLFTKQTKILIPYKTSNYEDTFSVSNITWINNGKYIILRGVNGMDPEERLLDATTGNLILLPPQKENKKKLVEIGWTWIPSKNKISYIQNGSIILSNFDGSEKEILVEGVDEHLISPVGGGSDFQPYWSESGRYLIYYKDHDLFINDTINKTETLINKGGFTDSQGGTKIKIKVATFGPFFFSKDEKTLYLNNYYDSLNPGFYIAYLDISSGKMTKITNFGWADAVSPKKDLFLDSHVENNPQMINIYSLTDNSIRSCSVQFDSLTFGNLYIKGWNLDGQAVLLLNLDAEHIKRELIREVKILNPYTCYSYDLIKDSDIDEFTWFPK